MFKHRLFVSGLGIGLIIGAILLQLIWLGTPEKESNEELDLQTLGQMALAEGYMLIESDGALYTADDVSKLNEQAVEQAKKEWNQQTPALAQDEQNDPPQSEQMMRAFTIGPGTDSTMVSRMLFEIGLIPDQEQFETRLKELNLSSKIQVNYYVFNEQPSLDELIKSITNTQ